MPAREPKRSTTIPATGVPPKRPSANAVTVCAAKPRETSNSEASTGIAGRIIAHPKPDSSVLLYSTDRPRAVGFMRLRAFKGRLPLRLVFTGAGDRL